MVVFFYLSQLFGGGLNPVVSIATMLLYEELRTDGLTVDKTYWIIYSIAPLIGGVIAGILFKFHARILQDHETE
jgi:glycerol uptake facilitator-like aquaporin